MDRPNLRTGLLAALVLTAAGSVAHAQSSATVASIPDGGTTVTLDRSPSPSSITLELDATVSGTASVRSHEQRAGSVTATATSGVEVSSGMTPLIGATAFGSASGTVAAGGTLDLPFIGTGSNAITVTPGAPTASPIGTALAGTGKATLGVSASTAGAIHAPLNVDATLTSQVGATVGVIYGAQASNGGGTYGSVDTTLSLSLSGFGFFPRTTLTQTRVIASETTGWSHGIAFNRFDATLGRLLDVTIALGGTLADRFTLTNTTGVAGTYTIADAVLLALSGSDAGKLSTDLSTRDTGSAAAGSTVTGNDATSSVNPGTLDDRNLAAYNGPGEVGFTVDSFGTVDATGGGGWTLQNRGEAGATVTLTYDYDPNGLPLVVSAAASVPAPALPGVAMLGLALLARRRR